MATTYVRSLIVHRRVLVFADVGTVGRRHEVVLVKSKERPEVIAEVDGGFA